jgi:hypothetical protein
MSVRHGSFASLAILAVCSLAACERYVVLDPQTAASRNAPDWTIRSQPGVSATAPTPTAPAASATAPVVQPAPSDAPL